MDAWQHWTEENTQLYTLRRLPDPSSLKTGKFKESLNSTLDETRRNLQGKQVNIHTEQKLNSVGEVKCLKNCMRIHIPCTSNTHRHRLHSRLAVVSFLCFSFSAPSTKALPKRTGIPTCTFVSDDISLSHCSLYFNIKRQNQPNVIDLSWQRSS